MINAELLMVKAVQRDHTVPDIFPPTTVTRTGIFQIGCDFDAGLRIKVMNLLTDTQRRNHAVNLVFLTTIDKLCGTLTGNTDDIPLALDIKRVRPVSHTGFHNLKVLNCLRPAKTTEFNYLRN